MRPGTGLMLFGAAIVLCSVPFTVRRYIAKRRKGKVVTASLGNLLTALGLVVIAGASIIDEPRLQVAGALVGVILAVLTVVVMVKVRRDAR